MMKALFIYNSENHDYQTDVVADDYVLQANETFMEPVGADGAGIKLPVSFDGTKWIEATDDEHKAYLDANIDSKSSTGSSAEDKTIAELTLQIAQNKTEQDAVNAQLLLLMAQQTEKETI